ncbi:MAG: LysM peptidoglycan-binding domain-containing protein, partial [Nocardioides sp.]|nr:LysM peptidoglycan-binding domain-containing protein [Nocardioides sp.]
RGECKASAYIWIGSGEGEPVHAEMKGADLVDMGPGEFAVGEVGLDEQGLPATYTVAPGDMLTGIGDRFCIFNPMDLGTMNNYPASATIQPGDVLILNADYLSPTD